MSKGKNRLYYIEINSRSASPSFLTVTSSMPFPEAISLMIDEVTALDIAKTMLEKYG